MVTRIKALASTPFPSGSCCKRAMRCPTAPTARRGTSSYSPLVERITRERRRAVLPRGGQPRRRLRGRFATIRAAQHAVGALPADPAGRSPRRLSGYPTFAFGYGHLFAIAIDSNIAADPVQLAWVTDQLEHLDRSRYRHVIAFFHHPPFSSGPHGGVAPGPAVTRTTTWNGRRPRSGRCMPRCSAAFTCG